MAKINRKALEQHYKDDYQKREAAWRAGGEVGRKPANQQYHLTKYIEGLAEIAREFGGLPARDVLIEQDGSQARYKLMHRLSDQLFGEWDQQALAELAGCDNLAEGNWREDDFLAMLAEVTDAHEFHDRWRRTAERFAEKAGLTLEAYLQAHALEFDKARVARHTEQTIDEQYLSLLAEHGQLGHLSLRDMNAFGGTSLRRYIEKAYTHPNLGAFPLFYAHIDRRYLADEAALKALVPGVDLTAWDLGRAALATALNAGLPARVRDWKKGYESIVPLRQYYGDGRRNRDGRLPEAADVNARFGKGMYDRVLHLCEQWYQHTRKTALAGCFGVGPIVSVKIRAQLD